MQLVLAFCVEEIPHKGVLGWCFVCLNGCCPPVRRCQALPSPTNRLLLSCSRHTTFTSKLFDCLSLMVSKSLKLVRVSVGKDCRVCTTPCLTCMALPSRCFWRFKGVEVTCTEAVQPKIFKLVDWLSKKLFIVMLYKSYAACKNNSSILLAS